MKAIKVHLRSFALLLSVLILLQGCTVYKSTTVSLDQAVQSESKVRVYTNTNEKLKFKRIGLENGSYYGVEKINSSMVRTPLDQDYINRINEKDKTLSTVLNIGIPIVIVGALIGIAAASCCTIGPGSFSGTPLLF